MKKDEQIKLVMEEFNFEKIHSVMTHQQMKWNFGGGDKRIPTIEELKHNAELQLRKAMANELGYFSLGGFEASFENNILQLRFILETSNPLGALFNPKK